MSCQCQVSALSRYDLRCWKQTKPISLPHLSINPNMSIKCVNRSHEDSHSHPKYYICLWKKKNFICLLTWYFQHCKLGIFVPKGVYLCFEQHLRILEVVLPILLPHSTNEDSDHLVSSTLITWNLSSEYVRCTRFATTAIFHSWPLNLPSINAIGREHGWGTGQYQKTILNIKYTASVETGDSLF